MLAGQDLSTAGETPALDGEVLDDAPSDEEMVALAPRPGKPAGVSPNYDNQESPKFARALCRLGATNSELADWFGVNTQTILNWQSFFPKFNEALRVGKGEFDAQVVRSLAARARGYSYDAVKIFLVEKTTSTVVDGAVVEEVTVKEPLVVSYREHVPPDTNACSLWLRNRLPDEWRDTQDRRMSGNLNVTISKDEALY